MPLDVSHIAKPRLPYRYEFGPRQLDAVVACTEAHGFGVVQGLLPDRLVDLLQAEVRRVVAARPPRLRRYTEGYTGIDGAFQGAAA